MCAPGNTDILCETQLAQSCFANITTPALYKGCMDLPDSDYYMYSLGGYAPCFYYDFNSVENFEITINCMVLWNTTNLTGPVTFDSLQPGYQYRDVIIPA